MPSILLSGPAGSAKSQEAKRLLSEATEPTVQADFQSIVVALLGLVRGPGGRYPVRPSWVLPITEFTRQAVISGANSRGLSIVATTSDGSPERRRALLDRLGPAATERIIDPGEAVVRARLADEDTGELSGECSRAVARWYGRVGK